MFLRCFSLLIAFICAVAPHLHALDETSKADPSTYPPAYIATIREAMRAFAQRDFAAATKLVDKADVTFQVTPLALNIRGAIAIEQQRFDEGREFCERALKDDPKFFPARFNLCEIPFVQGKYAEARAMFEKVQQDYPKDDLLKFRIFLTYLLEKNEEAARAKLADIPFLSDTPVYYYANAAWEFAHGNEAEAKSWLDRGNFVFPPVKHLNFIDVFYDLGWVERPGAEAVAAAETPPE